MISLIIFPAFIIDCERINFYKIRKNIEYFVLCRVHYTVSDVRLSMCKYVNQYLVYNIMIGLARFHARKTTRMTKFY